VEKILNKIANRFKRTGDGFSYKIFTKDQLAKYEPFKTLSWEYLIVKTKNGKATNRAYYVGTIGSRVSMNDACFYQRTRAARFNVIQKII
tara:strand:+ start:334 stop:603 length:270 start_codon:yes stop_codon:yes gene_type:complete